jgi:hypothetical protein
MIEGRQGRVPTDILCRDHHSLQALLIDDQRMEGKCWNTQIASFLLTVCQSLPTLKTSLIHSYSSGLRWLLVVLQLVYSILKCRT